MKNLSLLISSFVIISSLLFVNGASAQDYASSLGLIDYYLIRPANIQCLVAPCPSHILTLVNTNQTEVQVIGVRFLNPNHNQTYVLESIDDVLVKGVLVPSLVYPGYLEVLVVDYLKVLRHQLKIALTGQFYALYPSGIICKKAPCPSLVAVELNTGKSSIITGFDEVYTTHIGLFDSRWLNDKLVYNRNKAVIRGILGEGVIFGTQVFVNMPDPSSPCPPVVQELCTGSDQVNVFTRDENRCPVADGCTQAGACILSIPVCQSGYTLASLPTRPFGCPAYYCDADFITPQPHP
eukprot:gene8324-10223_t